MSEVLYADVKFKNPKGINAQADASTSNDSAYSEVRFPRAQGNDPSQDTTDDSASQPVGSKGGSKVASGRCDAVKVGLGLLCALLLAAVIALTVLYLQNKDLQKNHTDMQTKDTDKQTQEAIRKNLTDSIKELRSCQAKQFSCPEHIQPPKGPTCNKPCATGWESYGGKCYWFSSDKHTWDESRNACTIKGANLVKIDSKAEQRFLQGKLMQKMIELEDKFWIGLTDANEEGTWVWADGSPLTESFWSEREPDNWKEKMNKRPEGEDCGRMGEKFGSSDSKSWFDTFCDKPHKCICEKQADPGRLESTCI